MLISTLVLSEIATIRVGSLFMILSLIGWLVGIRTLEVLDMNLRNCT